MSQTHCKLVIGRTLSRRRSCKPMTPCGPAGCQTASCRTGGLRCGTTARLARDFSGCRRCSPGTPACGTRAERRCPGPFLWRRGCGAVPHLSGAGGWRTEVLDGAFCHASRWRLGVATTSPGQTCHIRCQAAGGCCAQPFTQSCASTGVLKHTATPVLSTNCGHCSANPGPVCPPTRSRCRAGAALTARGRGSFAWAGCERYADVTIRHPCADKYVRQAAVQDGAALRLAETGKRSRYPAVASAGLEAVEPLAVETFGRLGPNAVRLLRTAWQHAAEQQPVYARWAGPAMHQKWLAAISLAGKLGVAGHSPTRSRTEGAGASRVGPRVGAVRFTR